MTHHQENADSEAMSRRVTNQHIRIATSQDLDVLVALEEICFSLPWSRENFEAELSGNQFSRMLIIEDPDSPYETQAIGYLCAWVVFEEIRFLNMAVHPDFRRQGLARQLIGEALRQGSEGSCCRGMLEVRETNMPAQALYKSFHFQPYATRKAYYTNPTEDAILMTLEPLIPEIGRKET